MMLISDDFYNRVATVSSNGNVLARDLLEFFDSGESPDELDGSWRGPITGDIDPTIGALERKMPDGSTSIYNIRNFIQSYAYTPFWKGPYSSDTLEEFYWLFCYGKHIEYDIVSDYDSIYAAYSWDNYDPWYTLNPWGVHLEHKRYAECYAHFLTECVDDCRVIVVYADDGKLAARGVIWDNVGIYHGDDFICNVSFLDNVRGNNYGTCTCVSRCAVHNGISLQYEDGWQALGDPNAVPEGFFKYENGYGTHAEKEVHIPKGYKYGIPHQMYFTDIQLTDDDRYIITQPWRIPYSVPIKFRHGLPTEWDMCMRCGYPLDKRVVCNRCGHSIPVQQTDFGSVYVGRMVDCGEYGKVPEHMVNLTSKEPKLYRGAKMCFDLYSLTKFELELEKQNEQRREKENQTV